MRFQIGDLVTTPDHSNSSLGVVVKVIKANSTTLASSSHTKEHLKNSPDVYFVFYPDTSLSGPYYTSELTLKNEA